MEEPNQMMGELEPVHMDRSNRDHLTTLELIFQGKADTFLNI